MMDGRVYECLLALAFAIRFSHGCIEHGEQEHKHDECGNAVRTLWVIK